MFTDEVDFRLASQTVPSTSSLGVLLGGAWCRHPPKKRQEADSHGGAEIPSSGRCHKGAAQVT